jgi:16S rRNA (cytosine(967)-C(5))-methyltransferase
MKDSLAVAIEALSWMAYSGLGERTALFQSTEQLGIDDPDELRQAHRLVMETTRFRNRLEFLASRALGSNLMEKAPHGVSSFLKIMAYLKFERHASERELQRNVGWARQVLGWKELQPYEKAVAKLVSGAIDAQTQSLPESEGLSLETCHPDWLVERLINVFGRDSALQILRRNLRSLPTYVRLNSLKIRNRDEKKKIASQLTGEMVPKLADTWRVDQLGSVLVKSNLLQQGVVVIQDLASAAAGLVASPQPGSMVLDVCAAPGNKTNHLAELMRNKGVIYSIDISEKRLSHWKQEMNRTGVSIAVPIRADARRIPLKEEFDVVLVDPPCSNTGVFSRNPSVKWKISQARIKEHSLRQYSILQAVSERVQKSGTLVYCTCSILPEENESVLEAFLRQRPEFKVVPQTPFLGSPGLRGFDLCQRFYPHLHECNGYFIAKLQRTD